MMNSQTKLNIAFSIARVFAILSIVAVQGSWRGTLKTTTFINGVKK